MEIVIRQAFLNDADHLTKIAFAAKRTWGYPESHFEIWASELTVSKEYIQKNTVFVAEFAAENVGFLSIVEMPSDSLFGQVLVNKGFWMDHLFVDPKFQHKGIGSSLVEYVLEYCRKKGVAELKIFVDPNASMFYEKKGALFLEYSPSSIEGRDIPVYCFRFEDCRT